MPDPHRDDTLARWRLVLGRFAQETLPCGGGKGYGRMERALDYLYGREYGGRGVRAGGAGSLDPSVLAIPEWLREVRDLFPKETVEVIEGHALERYRMTELVTDEEVLRRMEPSYELLKAILTFKDLMDGPVLEVARGIVRRTVEEIRRRLERDVRRTLWGRLSRRHPTRHKVARNLDWRRTIRENLKRWDPERRRLVVEKLHFLSRVDRHLPWHVILAVDCSGSMIDSVITSAIMAGIFASLPSLACSLVAFDTSVVDLTDQAGDPTRLLMSVQLGGGTDIGGALAYCESLVRSPQRTVVIVVTDFCEGAAPSALLAAIRRLRGAGARVLGLAALDERAEPQYDRDMAEQCAAAGAEIAALTPGRLAEWLGRILS